METIFLAIMLFILAATAAAYYFGQARHWGVSPMCILGLGIFLPIGGLAVGLL